MSVLDTTRLAVQSLEVTIIRGSVAVMAEAPRVAALAESVPDLPITARWPWLSASVAKPAAEEEPWMVALSSGHRLVAAALLIDDRSGAVCQTYLAGTAEHHRGAMLASDAATAAHLGAALADALMGELREFTIGPISDGPVVAALLRCLQVGVVVDEVAVPVVYAMPGLAEGISHGMARTLRKASNRMARGGVEAAIAVTGDGNEITAMLPLLESISRDRDLAAGRPSPLDDVNRRRLWQRRVMALASVGSLRLATLRLDGGLAAYVLGIEDGATYRILEGRYVAHWARYAPGRVLEAAVLDSVVQSETLSTLDWMTDIAPETLLATNGVDPLVVIHGRTNPAS